MGRSAALYPLVPTGTTPRPPTNRAVREVVTQLLEEWFEGEETGTWGGKARGWLEGGETALVTVQDDDELGARADTLALRINRYADAPVALAEHWLAFVMAWRRDRFEGALAELGVAIPPDRWPDLREVCANQRLFVHDDQVGSIDGDVVRWAMSSQMAPSYSTPVAELPDEVRERVAAMTHCACPLCERFATSLHPAFESRSGCHAETLVSSFLVSRLVAPRAGGVIATLTHRRHMAWTARVVDGVLHSIPELSHQTREVRLLQEVGDALVAFFVYPHDAPCEWSESRDGGITWSKAASTGLPAVKGMRPYFSDARRDRVFVAAPDGAIIHRSDDGGRSFGPPVQVVLDGRPAYAIRDAMSCGDHVFALLVREYEGATVVAVSDDGAAFTTCSPGLDEVASLWATTDGALVSFGSADDEDTLSLSRDGGQSWERRLLPPLAKQAALGGRWFVTAEDALWISDDEGETWREVVGGAVHEIALDGADPSSCYACLGGLLVRVVVGA